MSFDAVLGQPTAVATLRRALATGRVHHAYRFEGPEGVGKELAALALARALLCEAPTPEACGRCGACERATRFSVEPPCVPQHPDLVILERGLYPAAMLGGEGATETTQLGVAQVKKLVQSRLGFAPHEGRALVFVIRAADELSVAAANTLLKTLEEPPPRTHFVLLTSRPSRLLDTIRSRTLTVRFGPLPDAIVADLLRARGLPPELATLAGGSAARALTLADEERRATREAFLARARAALDAPDLRAAFELAGKGADRIELREQLGEFALGIAEAARALVHRDLDAALREAERHRLVLAGMRDLERNLATGLALEAMTIKLRRA